MFTMLLILGATLSYKGVQLPWTLCSVPYAAALVIVGTYLKDHISTLNKIKVSTILLCLLIPIFISLNWKLDIAWNKITPILPLTIGAISGTIMCFGSCMILNNRFYRISSILQHIGRETFVILAFSQCVSLLIEHYLNCNSVLRYILMFLILYLVVVIKNNINKILKYKLL